MELSPDLGLSSTRWLIGRLQAPAERIRVRSGRLQMEFDPATGALRYLTVGGVEVLRGVYAAVRDHNWGTIEPRIRILRMEVGEAGFEIELEADCRSRDIDYRWLGSIRGSGDESLVYEFQGTSDSCFRRNRIGFCVLHPLAGVAGAPCRIVHVDSAEEESVFPLLISPFQPFRALRSIRLQSEGLQTIVTMEGDTFETEDQRNWTDASFKTYCTPLEIPYPVEVRPGDRVWQRVTVEVRADAGIATAHERGPRPVILEVGRETGSRLPCLGVGAASDGQPLDSTEIIRLRQLRPTHLRIDLRLYDPAWRDLLRQGYQESAALGTQLELSVHLSASGRTELEQLAKTLDAAPVPLTRMLIHQRSSKVTPEGCIAWARTLFAVPVGAGTDAFFAELNRERPKGTADFLFFPVNPQVHAFDEASIVETLEALPDTVATARAFGGRPVAVSPLTLRPRFNPNATGPEPSPGPGELPPPVDHRQPTLFGAAWTLGAIEALSRAQCESLTLYETTGWRGLMERADGNPLPQAFFSIPGAVFPVYHVLRDLADFMGSPADPAQTSDPLRVRGLTLRKGNRMRLLAANLTPEALELRVFGLPEGPLEFRSLQLDNIRSALVDPEGFHLRNPALLQSQGALSLSLSPYAVIRIDSRTP